MNVHDSERMAGLLEQAGYEADGRAARCRCRRHQHVQRARARRREALYATRGSASGEPRDGPHAGCGRRRLRGAAGSRGAAQALEPDRRHHRHAEPEAAACARRTGARGRRCRTAHRCQRVRGRVVSAGRCAAARSGEGVRHDHRRLQRVLLVLRGAVYARAASGCARSATSSTK